MHKIYEEDIVFVVEGIEWVIHWVHWEIAFGFSEVLVDNCQRLDVFIGRRFIFPKRYLEGDEPTKRVTPL